MLKIATLKAVSFCMVAGIAATVASFSQTPTPDPTVPASVAHVAISMPVAHTLTSKDGRTIDVTILSKSDTAIKAARADGKEFEIALDKLSDADKAFIVGLANLPVKKLKVLLLGGKSEKETLEKAGIEWVEPKLTPSPDPQIKSPAYDVSNLTAADLQQYDLIWWNDAIHRTDREKFLGLLKEYQGVIARYFPAQTTLTKWFEDEEPTVFIDKPFVKSQSNVIFYSPCIMKGPKVIGDDPTITQKVVEEFQKLQLKYHN